MKRALIVVVALTAIGIGTGFAATLPVGTHHLWAGAQTLTKSTCTVTGGTDTWTDEQHVNQGNGTATTLSVQPDTNKRRWALVMFDLSSCALPTTGGADSAFLKLTVTTTATSSRTLTVTPITSTWSGSTTWSSTPTFAGSATTTFASGTTPLTTISIPVTVDVDSYIKGSANYGWRIADLGSTAASDTTTFASSDAATGKPQLVINSES